MKKSEELLKLIDEGVPPSVAMASLGVSEEAITPQLRAILDKKHALALTKIFRSLYMTTQRASANPSAIASAAQAYIKLAEKGASQRQNIQITISGEEKTE